LIGLGVASGYYVGGFGQAIKPADLNPSKPATNVVSMIIHVDGHDIEGIPKIFNLSEIKGVELKGRGVFEVMIAKLLDGSYEVAIKKLRDNSKLEEAYVLVNVSSNEAVYVLKNGKWFKSSSKVPILGRVYFKIEPAIVPIPTPTSTPKELKKPEVVSTTHLKPTLKITPTKKSPGFELFIAGTSIAVAYAITRRRK